MNNKNPSEILIRELLADPREFEEKGKAYQLLQYYFKGKDIESLRPLLMHKDNFVRRAAAFISVELGAAAQSLIDVIEPLTQDADPHIQWNALESVMICSSGNKIDRFWQIARALEEDNDSICSLAMRLVSNADIAQLRAALKKTSSFGATADIHRYGLSTLLSGQSEDISRMLDDPNHLTTKYGAIGAKRLFQSYPDLLERASKSSDAIIQQFADEALQMEN